MSNAGGFDCPEGTRLIIQRPDGYFTALVTGKVLIHALIAPGKSGLGFHIPDEIVGAEIHLDLDLTWDENGTLYTTALGKYEAK